MNTIRFLIVVIFFCLCGQNSHSQRINIQLLKTMQKDVNVNTRLQNPQSSKKEKDFVLYRNVVRRFSWLEGVGDPISIETAHHLPYYFRFSKKLDSGHWQHIQAMYGDEMTTNHRIGTYIIDKEQDDDMMANPEWLQKIRTITQWLFIPSAEGKQVYEERAYDAKGNMVYSFTPVPNSTNEKVIGSYNDAWGLPAEMRDDSLAVYGSLVAIEYDSLGFDAQVSYIDGAGYPRKNSNGVEVERLYFDRFGRKIGARALTVARYRCYDNWGNCGYEIKYSNNNRTDTLTYYDIYWDPMPMPSLRADSAETFTSCIRYYDQYGRDSLHVIQKPDGTTDSTLNGVHSILYDYTDDGVLRQRSFYGSKGEFLYRKP